MSAIHAIYEDGVFKPTERVDLPEHCKVIVNPESDIAKNAVWDDIYSILAERYRSGEHDVAERHNEHQP